MIIWLQTKFFLLHENCDKAKKVECGKAHFTSLMKMMFAIDEAAIGLL